MNLYRKSMWMIAISFLMITGCQVTADVHTFSRAESGYGLQGAVVLKADCPPQCSPSDYVIARVFDQHGRTAALMRVRMDGQYTVPKSLPPGVYDVVFRRLIQNGERRKIRGNRTVRIRLVPGEVSYVQTSLNLPYTAGNFGYDIVWGLGQGLKWIAMGTLYVVGYAVAYTFFYVVTFGLIELGSKGGQLAIDEIRGKNKRKRRRKRERRRQRKMQKQKCK